MVGVGGWCVSLSKKHGMQARVCVSVSLERADVLPDADEPLIGKVPPVPLKNV